MEFKNQKKQEKNIRNKVEIITFSKTEFTVDTRKEKTKGYDLVRKI